MKTEQEIREDIKRMKNINEILKTQYAKYGNVETAIDISKNEAYIEALEKVLDEIEE